MTEQSHETRRVLLEVLDDLDAVLHKLETGSHRKSPKHSGVQLARGIVERHILCPSSRTLGEPIACELPGIHNDHFARVPGGGELRWTTKDPKPPKTEEAKKK